MTNYEVQATDNGWTINKRWQIYSDDGQGTIYDTLKAEDIPQWVFKARDVLMKTIKAKKPLFTTKHYKAIAEVLKKIGIYASPKEEQGVVWTVLQLATYFEKGNPKFNSKKFVESIMVVK